MNPNQKIVIGLVILTLVISGLFIYLKPQDTQFCFTFLHDTQFGDRVVEKPANEGFLGPGGVAYFPLEIKALQTALKNETYYIDPYEETGGGVYMGGFFGPSTQNAVKSFQRKYHLEATGEVDNSTIDQLNDLYACPPTETVPQTTATSSITQ